MPGDIKEILARGGVSERKSKYSQPISQSETLDFSLLLSLYQDKESKNISQVGKALFTDIKADISVTINY